MPSTGPSESVICRSIVDRNEVVKSQIIAAVMESMAATTKQHKQQALIAKAIEKLFQSHTNGLVDSVSREFSKK